MKKNFKEAILNLCKVALWFAFLVVITVIAWLTYTIPVLIWEKLDSLIK